MALASGSPGYTPPANIRAYRKLHWNLPARWAAPEDIVWDGENCLAPLFASDGNVPDICPWGWSPALVHELELAGVPRLRMPDTEWLGKLRRLSGRESTAAVQRSFGIDVCVCRDVCSVERCIDTWGDVILKSPWSSSGKGLMLTDNPNWRCWTARVLRRQEAVIVERFVKKKLDFAMEFLMEHGTARYMGLNVFRTDARGHFLDNTDGTEQEFETMIAATLRCPGTLAEVRRWYVENLPRLASWYSGPVGVDMLVTAEGTVHPCVEINWRMTMGMAKVLSKLLVSDNKESYFLVNSTIANSVI